MKVYLVYGSIKDIGTELCGIVSTEQSAKEQVAIRNEQYRNWTTSDFEPYKYEEFEVDL